MRLQRLTALEVEKFKKNLQNLKKVIADLRDILAKPERVIEIIKTELLEIKDKYNDKRRSEITLRLFGYRYRRFDRGGRRNTLHYSQRLYQAYARRRIQSPTPRRRRHLCA